MKLKLILMSALFVSFMSCKDSGQTADTAETEEIHEHGHNHDNDELHSNDQKGMKNENVLALNNGEKWKSDDPTNMHAQNLIGLNQDFRTKASDANLEMFRNYADMLQQELNGMIKDCKMDGPDHDALHLWLEPVLNRVKDLKNAETDEKAKEIDADLSGKIMKYDQFFN